MSEPEWQEGQTVEGLTKHFIEEFAPTADLPELREEFRDALDDLLRAAHDDGVVEGANEERRLHSGPAERELVALRERLAEAERAALGNVTEDMPGECEDARDTASYQRGYAMGRHEAAAAIRALGKGNG